MPDSESSETTSIISEEVVNIVRNEPMYFVLSQFLETPDGEDNVASLLKQLVNELKELNLTLKNKVA